MTIKTNLSKGKATIAVNVRELALINYALGCFQQLAAAPNAPYDPTDADHANMLEKQLFSAYCEISDGLHQLVQVGAISNEDYRKATNL